VRLKTALHGIDRFSANRLAAPCLALAVRLNSSMDDLVSRFRRIHTGQARLAQDGQKFKGDGFKRVGRRVLLGAALDGGVDAALQIPSGLVTPVSGIFERNFRVHP
jgi:hypothetical protein